MGLLLASPAHAQPYSTGLETLRDAINGDAAAVSIVDGEVGYTCANAFFLPTACTPTFLNNVVTSLGGSVASATALANVGPGLGPIIGPVGNFAPLPDTAKWLMSLAMLLGRLEILAVLVIFTPTFWRR